MKRRPSTSGSLLRSRPSRWTRCRVDVHLPGGGGWDGKTSIQPDRQFGRNAQHGKDRARTANEASGQTEKEGDFVRETVGAMREITQSISDVGDIAYQTNLLALNSAIEAARAGTHGKGFAIVAGEVRKLAELSQTAAQQMSDLAKISVDVAENAAFARA